ncbi:MAG TPA: phosphoribosylformylglycinamidine synthase subunit PurQ [Spirochaetia bacterium]|nr:phosphoribosylformylglycinamidine synthase subunit PurQ [Spirochaetia bacterium]
MRKPRVCIITGFGINADEELAYAFDRAGGESVRVHVRDLIDSPRLLSTFRILAFPGGFSFGDHLGSGKVFATLFRRTLGAELGDFVASGGLVLGICNGFQVLVKMGALPNLEGRGAQEVSLIHNDSGKYEDRWVRVRFEQNSRCVWTRGLSDMDLPVRHGEGKFVVRGDDAMGALTASGLIALRYAAREAGGNEVGYPDDPNGSAGHVAGICDLTGRVFGLMPHPEAFLHAENHPQWNVSAALSRYARRGLQGEGLRILANGVRAAARS